MPVRFHHTTCALRAPDRGVRVLVRERVQRPPNRVHDSRMRPGEELEREERRAARCRALVFQAAAKQLGLLVEAELSDRAIREGPLPIVLAPRRGLEIVVDRATEIRKSSLVVQLSGALDGLGEVSQPKRASEP